jgi:hypothetical protein
VPRLLPCHPSVVASKSFAISAISVQHNSQATRNLSTATYTIAPADLVAERLPQLISKMDKDQLKKLKLTTLRTP